MIDIWAAIPGPVATLLLVVYFAAICGVIIEIGIRHGWAAAAMVMFFVGHTLSMSYQIGYLKGQLNKITHQIEVANKHQNW